MCSDLNVFSTVPCVQMAVEAKKQVTARQGSLRAAFSLLDTRQQEWIDGPTMIALFLAIGNYR